MPEWRTGFPAGFACLAVMGKIGEKRSGMSRLTEILAQHTPILLIDAASARIQVGLIGGDGLQGAWWAASEEEAGVGIFRGIESLEIDIGQIRGFIFAEGPGSVLGVRTAAMALRAWCAIAPRPVYAYHGLALLAHADGRAGMTFIADARRDSWHCCRLGESVRRVPTAELAGPLAMPDGFRNWSPLPPGVERVPYVLADLLPKAAAADLFRSTEEPDAFLHQEPQYAAWLPQIHRAP